MTDERVVQAEVGIAGEKVTVFYAAFSYPTETAAAKAWERASRKGKLGQAVSVYRLPNDGQPLVVALSEDQADVSKMVRVIATAGTVHKLDQGTLWNLVMRRGRVAHESDSVGDSRQQNRYGRSGAEIGPLGQARPHRRPQG